jgi:hemoglobin
MRDDDMSDEETVPSLASWAGGPAAIRGLFERFYQRVANHELLAPIFASMDPKHAEHVAAFVAEVLGGPKDYSSAGGSHAGMITRHLGRKLTQEQRQAWMALLLDTADELGLPDDPEFRASLVGYLEWGSRLAVQNSQEGVEAPDSAAPMPSWTWSSPGGPYRA